MKSMILATLALAAGAAAALAQASDEEQQRIDAALAAMQCEVDPRNVEVEPGGFVLDDVICADGQYDMVLDKAFEVRERRKE